MDETNDTAVTYQFFAIEEQEAERRRKKGSTKKEAVDNKPSEPAPKPKAPKAKEEKQISEQSDARDPASNADGHARESSDESGTKRDKKRKVTFNVQPNVVTIKREVKDEDDEPLPERADGKITQF